MDIQKKFEDDFKVKVFYCRMSKKEGNLVVNKFDANEEFNKKLEGYSLEIEDKLEVNLIKQGDELRAFLENHGNHY